MIGAGQKTRKLREAREESTQRGVRIAELGRAHRRLQHLYEISTLLARFQNVEQTVCAVIPIMAQTLPIRSAILILKTAPVPLTIAWQAKDESDPQLQEAKAHAQKTYARLLGTAVDLGLEQGQTHVLPRSTEELAPVAGSEARFFFLPLVVRQSEIFGALQVEDGIAFDEEGLIFVNSVVNQLAIAIDRQAAIAARQAAAEANETEQRLLAQVGAVVAASLSPEGTLGAIARCLVPSLADLCLVDLVDEKGELRRIDVVFADEEQQSDLVQQLHSSPQHALALEADKPGLFSDDLAVVGITPDDDLTQVLRRIGIESRMVLPLIAREKKLGVLTLIATKGRRHYSAGDLTLAEEIAHRTAISIDNVRLLEHAQKATQARDDLLAIVSHDLRNPLNVIVMNLATLLKVSESEERRKSRSQLQSVQRAAHRMNHLIEDLLDTVNIESGRLSVDERLVSVDSLVSEALEAVSLLAASKSMNLEKDLPVGLPIVRADARRIHQVLGNLLGNAIKFTPANGTITVRAEHVGDRVTFSVTDTGPGILEADLPHLFERLWQSKNTTGMGTGLGLFIVKGIVESHGGKVWVESRVGEGSTFFFSLPVATQ